MEIIILLIAMLGGLVQGVTGFGAGIVKMMVLPYFFALSQSAGISAAIGIALTAMMAYTYRKHVNLKKIILPCILYLTVSSFSILFAKTIDQELMKKVFGCFLVLLAIYYLFINKNSERKKLSLPVSIMFVVVSGICDGLFGIGGPLMVIYFLSQTHSTHEYLGTIQSFFFINSLYTTSFRLINGVIGLQHLVYIGIGIVGILIGGRIASKVVDHIDGVILRKLVYVMIGISGIINIL